MKSKGQNMDELKILRYIIESIFNGSLKLDDVDGDLRQYMLSLIMQSAPDPSEEEQKAIKKMIESKDYEFVIKQ